MVVDYKIMHEKAKDIIKRRNSKITEEWNCDVLALIKKFNFDVRKKTHPEECICYQQNKPCHNIDNLNCIFCFCSNYDLSVKEGRCKIDSPSAKYIDNHDGKILDCSDCDWPHKPENVKNILLKIYDTC